LEEHHLDHSWPVLLFRLWLSIPHRCSSRPGQTTFLTVGTGNLNFPTAQFPLWLPTSYTMRSYLPYLGTKPGVNWAHCRPVQPDPSSLVHFSRSPISPFLPTPQPSTTHTEHNSAQSSPSLCSQPVYLVPWLTLDQTQILLPSRSGLMAPSPGALSKALDL
jgi:hypothetical protein